ncbi:MAG TPA: hypothetical protein VLA16_02965, partial [Ideonella sp.]|nr:hypothetical protein [Ideonella sp.]
GLGQFDLNRRHRQASCAFTRCFSCVSRSPKFLITAVFRLDMGSHPPMDGTRTRTHPAIGLIKYTLTP